MNRLNIGLIAASSLLISFFATIQVSQLQQHMHELNQLVEQRSIKNHHAYHNAGYLASTADRIRQVFN